MKKRSTQKAPPPQPQFVLKKHDSEKYYAVARSTEGWKFVKEKRRARKMGQGIAEHTAETLRVKYGILVMIQPV